MIDPLADATAADPAIGLRAVRALRDLTDRLQHLQVSRARELGWSLQEIADAGIDSEHLRRLIDSPVQDADALAAVGIDQDVVQASAERSFGAGALGRATTSTRRGRLPLDKEAKKTLEIALREAIRLEHRSIDTGHRLLDILRITDGNGHALLLRAGGDPVALRTAVECTCGLPRSA